MARLSVSALKLTISGMAILLSVKAASMKSRCLMEKGSGDCSCGEKYTDDWTIPYYQRFVPIAIVGECVQHGLFFAAPQHKDLAFLDDANRQRHLTKFDPTDFAIELGPKSRDLLRRGIDNYLDLFSSRQLHYLRVAIDGLHDVDNYHTYQIGAPCLDLD